MRRIDFQDQALRHIQKQVTWYQSQNSTKAVRTMTRNLHSDISALASMPSIGRKYKLINGHQYYSFPSKKKADIIYRYDDQTLYIADVVFYFSKK